MGNQRELIDTGTDKRYVRRDDKGQFKESDDQSRSLGQDVRQHAGTKKPPTRATRGIEASVQARLPTLPPDRTQPQI
jgi:hypothetical protein